MLTGVVPSQIDKSKPLLSGMVRSNFWKGRQRLNRLYRWIANVVRPKIDGRYYAMERSKTILRCANFCFAATADRSRTTRGVVRDFAAGKVPIGGGTGRRAAVHRAVHRGCSDVRPCAGRSTGPSR